MVLVYHRVEPPIYPDEYAGKSIFDCGRDIENFNNYSYLLYEQLTSNGFYFLNQEFGEYNFENYKNLCTFMNGCTSDELETFFNTTFEKSKHNKEKLEAYIYSYKEKEINLHIMEFQEQMKLNELRDKFEKCWEKEQ